MLEWFRVLQNLQGNSPRTESVCTEMPQDHLRDQMAHEDSATKV